MAHVIRNLATEARREFAENRASRFFVALLVVMVIGLAALAITGNSFGVVGLLFLAGGLLSSVAVVVIIRAFPRARRVVLIGATALLPVWIVFGIIAAFLNPSLGSFLMANGDAGDFSYVGAAVQGFVVCAAIQGLAGLFGSIGRR